MLCRYAFVRIDNLVSHHLRGAALDFDANFT